MILGLTVRPGEKCSRRMKGTEHLVIAALECRPGKNQDDSHPKSCLLITHDDYEQVVCTLEQGLVHQQKIDLVLFKNEVITFTVEGTGTIYITGYTTDNTISYEEDNNEFEDSEHISSQNLSRTTESSSEDEGEGTSVDDHGEMEQETSTCILSVDELRGNPDEAQLSEATTLHVKEEFGTTSDEELQENPDQTQLSGAASLPIKEELVTTVDDENEGNLGGAPPLCVKEESGTASDDENELNPDETPPSGAAFLVAAGELGSAADDENELNPDQTGLSGEAFLAVKVELSSAEEDEDEAISDKTQKDTASPIKEVVGREDEDVNISDQTQNNAASPMKEVVDCEDGNPEEAAQIRNDLAQDSDNNPEEATLPRDFDPPQDCENISGRTRSRATICGKDRMLRARERNKKSFITHQGSLHCNLCSRAFRHKYMLQRHKLLRNCKKPCKHENLETASGEAIASNFLGKEDDAGTSQTRIMNSQRTLISRACQSIREEINVEKTHKSCTQSNRMSEGRLYKCQFCDKAFKWSSSRKKHERIHTGEKPYKCQFCGREFARSYNMKSHERIHEGGKPYKCQFCDRAFAHSSNLKKHERTHTGVKPFKCQYCSRAFAQSRSLVCHERMHTGEKPFKCQFCGKLFSRSSHLKRHEGIHSGEKAVQV